ncbi:MAG: NAD-dependent epimerase/dehydratase family protein [Chromatiales bacterium]|nr:NAD-dependent epimerase/dehydratase family protein [Chromatiales bacterium]MDH3895398.1 NAD-dependent epimerase/dehydratase family protein [Chromatiales bacterium]MDH3930982.1 NAD-dependent epimerase/dehydratase family protein [Chromatiales bacterium]MDH3945426.1 NAD-dependent epimerase/dehydratase family protein [Chromatiales bacterium]MDH4013076.1 NAD-dependent epimerase/dehydratase family protein [Chromatiales bacterium]
MDIPAHGLLIAGCGYTGQRLAALARADAIPCHCITSRAESAANLAAAGYKAFAVDLDADVIPAITLPPGPPTVIVYLAPPPADGDSDPRLERFLAALAGPPPAGIVYVSTTGVYGDRGGALTDETAPTQPQTGRGRRRLAAERTARSWAEHHGVGWIVLRVPGIYGPHRLPLRSLEDRVPVIREQEAGPGNRIHVDDLAAACLRAARLPMRTGIYNVGDGCYWSRTRFFACIAQTAGLPEPEQLPAADVRARVSPMAWSFIAESRRIDNRRMISELGVRLRYPDPANGIAASLAEMNAAASNDQG